jgi:surface antigen
MLKDKHESDYSLYPFSENSILIAGLRAITAVTAVLFALLLGISLANAGSLERLASTELPGADVTEGIVRVVKCRHGKIAEKLSGAAAAPLLVTGNIGMLMDEADRVCVRQILNHVSDGLAAVWDNRVSNVRYLLTPLHSARPGGEGLCRVYTAQAFAGGTVLETYQKACRLGDGVWRVNWGETFTEERQETQREGYY